MSIVRLLGGVSKGEYEKLESKIKRQTEKINKSLRTDINTNTTFRKDFSENFQNFNNFVGGQISRLNERIDKFDNDTESINSVSTVTKEEKEQMEAFKSRLDEQDKNIDCLNTKIVAQEAGEDEVVERIKKLEKAKASAFNKQNEDIRQQIEAINKKVDGVVEFSQKMAKTAMDANNDTRQIVNRAFNTRDNTIGNRFNRRPKSARVGNAIRRSKSFNPGTKKSSRKLTRRNTMGPKKKSISK